MKRRPRLRLPRFLSYWGILTLLACVPALSSWLDNRYQVFGVDLVIPVALSALTALVTAAAYWKMHKKNKLAAVCSGTLAVLILSSDYGNRFSSVQPILRSFNPIPQLASYEAPFLGLAFMGLVLLVAGTIGTRLATAWRSAARQEEDLRRGIIILIMTVFLVQAGSVAIDMVSEWTQFSYRPAALAASGLTAPADKPDIYYIVLDRYTNQTNLQQYLGFDNSPFISSLRSHGFSVNPNAYSNYPYTTMSVASTLSADYHTKLVEQFASSPNQTVDPYHQTIRYSPVISELKALGYSYYHLGTWYEASNQAPLADHYYQPDGQLTLLGRTFTLNNFPKAYLEDSPFCEIVKHGLSIGPFAAVSFGSQSEADATTYKLETLENLAEQPAGGRFIFAHLLIPHDPYYFNADGSLNPNQNTDNVGEPIGQKYVNQVRYINGQMQELVDEIDKKSGGKAAIIIQADEGPYPMQVIDQDFDGTQVGVELSGGDMRTWTDQSLKIKYGVLAAYRLPGATDQAMQSGGDSVNIFRLVFNTYFGGKLPYLPRCYYAYADGRSRSFVYSDITKRLTGQDNPACPADSDFKK